MAMDNSFPSTGILKKASQDKARQVAIHHATLLQQRKELEAKVLDNLITLSEYPLVRTPARTAANPAASDVADVKSRIRLFQPSDFDDLVIERNVNGLCGYTLCPKPNRKLRDSEAKFKLVNVGRQDFGIVPRQELERWCSEDCRRRALWIKIQLGETTAWERVGIPEIQISLYGEDELDNPSPDDDPARTLGRAISRLKLDEQRKAIAATEALALERGDSVDAAQSKNRVDVVIHEKEPGEVDDAQEPCVPEDDDVAHLFMEGYKVKFASGG